MPVKKPHKKTVSSQKRKEIREAANSIPGLLIEHVAFDENMNDDNREFSPPSHKYMLSAEKRREHQKKRVTVFIGVGTIVIALCILWVVNIKSFFFDSKFTASTEEQLLGSLKQDFDNTVGLVASRQSPVTSTPQDTLSEQQLQAALIAGLLASSTTSTVSASSSVTGTATSTTSTINVQTNSTTTSTP